MGAGGGGMKNWNRKLPTGAINRSPELLLEQEVESVEPPAPAAGDQEGGRPHTSQPQPWRAECAGEWRVPGGSRWPDECADELLAA